MNGAARSVVAGRTSSESGTRAPSAPCTVTARSSPAPGAARDRDGARTGTGSRERSSARCAASAPARGDACVRGIARARRRPAPPSRCPPRARGRVRVLRRTSPRRRRRRCPRRSPLTWPARSRRGCGRSVDLRHQRRQHRRTRRHPPSPDVGAVTGGDRREQRPQRLANGLTGGGAVVFWAVGSPAGRRPAARSAGSSPHEAAEAERCRGADVGLDVGHFRQLAQRQRQPARHGSGVPESSPGMSTTTRSSLCCRAAVSSPLPRCAAERAPSRLSSKASATTSAQAPAPGVSRAAAGSSRW